MAVGLHACNAKRWRSIPLPISAFLVMREWLLTAARSTSSRAEAVVLASLNASANAAASGVHDRIVSVLPCLNAAVEADS